MRLCMRCWKVLMFNKIKTAAVNSETKFTTVIVLAFIVVSLGKLVTGNHTLSSLSQDIWIGVIFLLGAVDGSDFLKEYTKL